MDDQRTAVVAVLAVILVLGVGLSLALTGLLPGVGDLGGGEDATTAPGPSGDGAGDGDAGASGGGSSDGSSGGTDGSSGGSADGTGDEATPVEPYQFRIDSIEECGTTCREVTATLTNTGEERRTDVVVTTKLLTDGDVIWEGDQEVDTLDSGESFTETRDVDVGFTGAYKINQNDGYVTIRTVVRSDQGTVTFEERRKVA